jgi:histidinol-phosphatase (PHP family)
MHDYHVHTHYCRHATGGLEEYARAAAARGLTEICFTPHVPLPEYRPGFFGGRLRMDPPEFPRFLDELERTRARVPELSILAGVEADYVEGTEEWVSAFLDAYPLDLVLMSVHFVRTWPEPQWVFDLSADSRPLERIYDDYLEALRSGIATGLFDCVAHFDLIKQPGHPLWSGNRAGVEEVISRCRLQGMSAEVNVSGLRKSLGEPFPAWEIVEAMIARGLPLVPGSDAHEPGLVGHGLDALERLPLVRYRGRRIIDPSVDARRAFGA